MRDEPPSGTKHVKMNVTESILGSCDQGCVAVLTDPGRDIQPLQQQPCQSGSSSKRLSRSAELRGRGNHGAGPGGRVESMRRVEASVDAEDRERSSGGEASVSDLVRFRPGVVMAGRVT